MSKKLSFNLVNPRVEGPEFKPKIRAKSSDEAAQHVWENLSKYFANSLPEFHFSLQDNNSKLHHYLVREHKKGDNVTFTIDKYNGKTDEDGFNKSYDNFQQTGGKKHRDDDDSSSSSSDSSIKYRKITSPLSMWWYYPYLYTSAANGYYYQPSLVTPVVLSNYIISLPYF